jgi:hypothetical protein
VEPNRWLPFVDDRFLVEWRDILFPQLQPGAATHTVEVFSTRGGISAPEFTALLESEERMQEEVFTHLPLHQINRYHQRVLNENLRMVSDYLAFSLHPVNKIVKGSVYKGVKP